MKTAKTLLSILLIIVLLCGCTSVQQTQPATTQDLQTQPTTQPTVPPTTQPTVPPTTLPPVTVPPVTEPQYKPAADFTVYDAEGNEVKLSDFIGQPVILNFWASWCFPCLAELPYFEKKSQEYGDQVQFLMVNVTSYDTMEDAKAVLENRGYTFPVFFDTEGVAAAAYHVSSIPATYAINAEGCIVKKVVGSLQLQDLQWLIDLVLAAE